ncbi:TRIC cation channel family protein [Candidatus Parcubacteria bacterium]|nr:TRIC cation channel family protein [Candidatus Parcubacteria bacterium]
MYFLDLLGTLAFAISGAFKAKGAKLNIFGVIFLGVVTAVGGGTIRDLILGKIPLFYLIDKNYLLISILASTAIYLMPMFFKRGYSFFRFLDSLGLATFAIIGVSISFNYLGGEITLMSFIASISLGVFTGCGGGILRDAIMDDKPFALMHGSNYIKSAFLGSLSFYILMSYNLVGATIVSIAIIMFLREYVSEYGVYKRMIKKNGK